MTARRRFVICLGLLGGFTLLGTLGYMAIEDLSPLEAAYMSVITISTVGYKEVGGELSTAGRVFTMFLIITGVGGVFYATVSLVTVLVEGQVLELREKQKLKRQISELSDHVIVCGYGRMGRLVVEQLRQESPPLVVVDTAAEKIASLEEDGVLCVKGDATEEATLTQAGIERARSLVACLPSDAQNVYVTLTARGLRRNLLIIARAEALVTEGKLLRAGADRVVCPQVIGAYRISSLILRPNVVDFVDVAAKGVELQFDEYRVSADSWLAGKSLRDSALRQKIDAMVVTIKRADGRTIFNPRPEEIVEVGDTLIMIGQLDTSRRLTQL